MYHCIILGRLLESIQLIEANNYKSDQAFLELLIEKAEKMLSWLVTIQYQNNQLPHVNDSTFGVAPDSNVIFNYAKSLGLQWKKIKLSDSGYRKFYNDYFELFVDFGKIGPDYLPGHAHSDTFNFELYFNGIPCIVDTGISTYNNNKYRLFERSTYAHNTVTINSMDQSEMWSVFRVADRAKVIDLTESENMIEATHTGYRKIGLLHKRKFNLNHDDIIISDEINNNNYKRESCLHFHPDREIHFDGKNIFIDKNIKLEFLNYFDVRIEKYEYCLGFNNRIESKKMVASINLSSEIRICYEKN